MKRVYELKPCELCGSSFKSYKKQGGKYNNAAFRFCSQECYHTSSRTIKERKCSRCNNMFRPKMNRTKFCSRECAFVIIPKNILGSMYESGMSLREIGNHFGLSQPRISQRMKEYGLETRKEMIASMQGGKPFNYVNGSSNTRRRTSTDRRKIKEWRKAVFERDDYTCKSCGIRGAYLEADHIKPFVLNPELVYELGNGQTLCRPCHRKKTSLDAKSYWINQYSKHK